MESNGSRVYLIGAGPGDPELMTIKGRGILETAQVVVYDHLVSKELLKFCGPGAEIIYVGKQPGRHSLSQEQINEILIDRARTGVRVVRLKGGDPFIFGRGGEEVEALEQAGIPFGVVPGISSAVAAPAYAGIPLTHRRYASSVAIVTGHEDSSRDKSAMRWEYLAHATDTLVFLMGVRNLEHIVSRLIISGKDPRTPAALVQWGTTPRQNTVSGALEEIASVARQHGMKAPAVLVVGEVVSLRSRLSWFEKSPLFGKRILITRSREQASELAGKLRAMGAEAVEFPTILLKTARDPSAVDAAIRSLSQYDWIVFTSPNGVRFFLERIKETGGDVRDLKGTGIAAIGSGTAEVLQSLGVRVDRVPQEYRAEALAETFLKSDVEGRRFLVPRAARAREVLTERLRQLGGSVDVVPVYETVMPEDGLCEIREVFGERQVDAVTFTSSSTVANFVQMAGEDQVRSLLQGVTVACIGPITAQRAREHGIEPEVVARVYTIDGLVEALLDHFRRTSSVSNHGVRTI